MSEIPRKTLVTSAWDRANQPAEVNWEPFRREDRSIDLWAAWQAIRLVRTKRMELEAHDKIRRIEMFRKIHSRQLAAVIVAILP